MEKKIKYDKAVSKLGFQPRFGALRQLI